MICLSIESEEEDLERFAAKMKVGGHHAIPT
jgi:hypothetical protein